MLCETKILREPEVAWKNRRNEVVNESKRTACWKSAKTLCAEINPNSSPKLQRKSIYNVAFMYDFKTG